jgi:RNA processing factor Prp31
MDTPSGRCRIRAVQAEQQLRSIESRLEAAEANRAHELAKLLAENRALREALQQAELLEGQNEPAAHFAKERQETKSRGENKRKEEPNDKEAKKPDTMIVQAVALLDSIGKEIETTTMRAREWYGWHFPELSMLVTPDVQYCQVFSVPCFLHLCCPSP